MKGMIRDNKSRAMKTSYREGPKNTTNLTSLWTMGRSRSGGNGETPEDRRATPFCGGDPEQVAWHLRKIWNHESRTL
jgi:hypothetical protein